jgi:uncharacterized membrane protein YkvA (DUF1232 family)
MKRDIDALYLAYQDPRTPWLARLAAIAVVAYALSPLDLIPDPIPVLGYLDDLVLLPLGIWCALRLIPPGVMADARRAAAERGASYGALGAAAAAVIVAIWLALAVWLWTAVLRRPR